MEGMKMSEMDEQSQARLMRLMDVYVNAVPEGVAKERLQIINSDGPTAIYFASAAPRNQASATIIAFKASRF